MELIFSTVQYVQVHQKHEVNPVQAQSTEFELHLDNTINEANLQATELPWLLKWPNATVICQSPFNANQRIVNLQEPPAAHRKR